MATTAAVVRDILAKHGRLASLDALGDDADLFAAGLDSFGMINVMIALEERFGIEFKGDALNRRSFSSVAFLSAAVQALQGEQV